MTDPIQISDAAERVRVTRIKTLFAELQASIRTSVERALEIGALLLEQKLGSRHGDFDKWLRQNVPFISVRSAERWMKLAKNRDKLDLERITSVTAAYKLLEESKPHEPRQNRIVAEQPAAAPLEPESKNDTMSFLPNPADTPFEAPVVVDESELTGDSYNLQQLKHYWRKASKADRNSFRMWIN